MTNQRLYTNKAMAIGAVIDAIECNDPDIIDIFLILHGRMTDLGYFDPLPDNAFLGKQLRLNDDGEIDDSDWEIVTNCTSEFD